MRGLRGVFVLGVVGVLVTATTACRSDEDEARSGQEAAPPGVVFVGTLGFSADRIAIDMGRPDQAGRQPVQAFVADGTPTGDAEWFEGTATDGKLELTSVSGKARLGGTAADNAASGTVTLADGAARPFHALPATHGAGLYEVTVTPDGAYTGVSGSGSQLQGHQNGNFVEGTITTPEGERLVYRDADLSRASDPAAPGGQPGTYTAIVSCSGLVQVGRGGDVRGGVPDANVIALDLATSTVNTPGVWHGTLPGGTEQFVMVVGEPNPAGARGVVVELADGQPEPEGDVEWFAGVTTGDTFALVSASRNAAITGQLGSVAAVGQVALPGVPPQPFFAVPAGDGAGIYEVAVTADGGYTGTSEQGGRLALRQQGAAVNGTLSTPDGRRIPVAAYDLSRIFDYPVEGVPPDRYTVFVSPSGRSVAGRGGDVRGGSAGVNLMSLGAVC